jgi:hypothetical protein
MHPPSHSDIRRRPSSARCSCQAGGAVSERLAVRPRFTSTRRASASSLSSSPVSRLCRAPAAVSRSVPPRGGRSRTTLLLRSMRTDGLALAALLWGLPCACSGEAVGGGGRAASRRRTSFSCEPGERSLASPAPPLASRSTLLARSPLRAATSRPAAASGQRRRGGAVWCELTFRRRFAARARLGAIAARSQRACWTLRLQ